MDVYSLPIRYTTWLTDERTSAKGQSRAFSGAIATLGGGDRIGLPRQTNCNSWGRIHDIGNLAL